MQKKMLKLGTALTVASAFLNATTAPAAAGGYYDNAGLINHYIQQAPWTGYGSGYGSGYGHDYGYSHDYDYGWKSWDYVPYKTGQSYGWTPKYDYPTYHYPKYDWPTSYVSTLGHGTVTYYDHYGDHVYYGEPAYAKRTTIVHPKVVYDDYGYGHVYDHDAYGDGYGYDDAGYDDDHVMHVGKHATDIRNPVFFASGSAVLDYDAQHELKEIGKIISAYYFGHPKVLILLSGFTDATGSQSANESLAKARNMAVMDFLIAEFGFDKDRFVLRAVGEDYANVSGDPYAGNLRKVTVSLVGLPKSATDQGHPHHEPAMAGGHEMAPEGTHEMTEPVALDKGELAPVEEHAMADPAPMMKPMPKPAPAMYGGEHMKPTYADYVKPVTRCYVQSGPYAGTYVDGKLLATLFTSIDDYGGGKLEEVCGLSY